MSTDTPTDADDYEVPPALAERARSALRLDDPPSTLGDWIDALDGRDEAAVTLGAEDLCGADGSRHEARIGGEAMHFHCVLDALVVPHLFPNHAPVEVRSRAPDADNVVQFTVAREGVDARPSDAVVSIGVARDAEFPPLESMAPGVATDLACPYINSFPDRSAYERWAAATPEAATMAVPAWAAHELARALAARFEADFSPSDAEAAGRQNR